MSSQRYAHALPYPLLSVSPQLAALHATRCHLPHDHFCTRCGHHSALHSTAVRRSTIPSLGSHAVTSVCNTCGHISRLYFDKGTTSSSFPSVKSRTRPPHAKHHSPIEQPKPVLNPVVRTKHKKKPGLADLLQRNRQKQPSSSSSQPHHPLSTALSAFLTTL